MKGSYTSAQSCREGGMGLLQLNRLDSSEMLESLSHQWKLEFFPYPSYHVFCFCFLEDKLYKHEK
jgi:hypothetical protein